MTDNEAVMQSTYNVIGLMSGTSVDGLDLVHCTFTLCDGKWDFKINKADTVEYTDSEKDMLRKSPQLSKQRLESLDVDLGHWFGIQVKKFDQQIDLPTDFVSSHGHTVFHEPNKGITLQIGDGQMLSHISSLPVVCEFRNKDVSLGGQGAPLVPIGDRLLFSQYDACLNLGGIGNISYERKRYRVAYDIAPVNLVFNHLAGILGEKYDKNGQIAASGKVDTYLLGLLNELEYYRQSPPKSLGVEWVKEKFLPILEYVSISAEDIMATCSAHIAHQICKHIPKGKILVTGGGSYNTHLVNQMKELTTSELVIGELVITEYKEALIFALLGVLRWRGEINCLKSVTGASEDSCCGTIYT